jgi:hypothetical protein
VHEDRSSLEVQRAPRVLPFYRIGGEEAREKRADARFSFGSGFRNSAAGGVAIRRPNLTVR